MIRRNYSSEFEKDDQDRQKPSRDFTRILRAAKPLWQEVLPKPENHIARGLVFAANRGITADLSFNKHRKRVLLMIRLHPKNGLSSSQLQSVSKVQNETEGLSSVSFDKENRIITIRSQSVLPASIMAEVVVPQVVEDAVTLLGNDNLRDIVEQSVSY
jgi:hypothetical protein